MEAANQGGPSSYFKSRTWSPVGGYERHRYGQLQPVFTLCRHDESGLASNNRDDENCTSDLRIRARAHAALNAAIVSARTMRRWT